MCVNVTLARMMESAILGWILTLLCLFERIRQGDGHVDVISASIDDGTIGLYLNLGVPSPSGSLFSGRIIISNTVPSAFVAVPANIAGVSDVLDVVSISNAAGCIYWHQSVDLLATKWMTRVVTCAAPGVVDISIGDVDDDGTEVAGRLID